MEEMCEFNNLEYSPLLRCPRLAWNEILKYLEAPDLLALRETCGTTQDAVDGFLQLEKSLENVAVALSPESATKFVEDVKTLPYTNFIIWSQGECFNPETMETFISTFGSRMKKLEVNTLIECASGDPDFKFYESLCSLRELKVETVLARETRNPNDIRVPLAFKHLTILDIERTESFFVELLIESQIGNRNLRTLKLPELRIDEFVVEDQVEGVIAALTKLGEARKTDLKLYSSLEIDFSRATEIFYITMYDHDEYDDEDENVQVLERSLRIPFHPIEEQFLMAMIQSKIRLKCVYSAFLQRLTHQDRQKFKVPLPEFFSCVTEITDGITPCLKRIDTPNLKSLSNIQFISRDDISGEEQERDAPNWNKLEYVGINQYSHMPTNPTLPLLFDGPPRPSVTSVYLAFKWPWDNLSYEKIFFQEIISVFPSLKIFHFTMIPYITVQDFLMIFKTLAEKTTVEELSLTLPCNASPSLLTEDSLLLNLKHMKSLSIATSSKRLPGVPGHPLLTNDVFVKIFSQLRLSRLSIESKVYWPNVTQAGVLSMINGPLAESIKVFRCPMCLINAPEEEYTAFQDAVITMQNVSSDRRRSCMK